MIMEEMKDILIELAGVEEKLRSLRILLQEMEVSMDLCDKQINQAVFTVLICQLCVIGQEINAGLLKLDKLVN